MRKVAIYGIGANFGLVTGGVPDCRHVALGQVHHVDVVPDAGSVRRGVVAAEYV